MGEWYWYQITLRLMLTCKILKSKARVMKKPDYHGYANLWDMKEVLRDEISACETMNGPEKKWHHAISEKWH